MKLLVMTLVLAISVNVSAGIYEKSGAHLLEQCTQKSGANEADALIGVVHCAGYLSGYMDSYIILEEYLGRKFYCPPEEGQTGIQQVAVVVKYLNDHPERLNESKRILVLAAYHDAWPCAENGASK